MCVYQTSVQQLHQANLSPVTFLLDMCALNKHFPLLQLLCNFVFLQNFRWFSSILILRHTYFYKISHACWDRKTDHYHLLLFFILIWSHRNWCCLLLRESENNDTDTQRLNWGWYLAHWEMLWRLSKCIEVVKRPLTF